MPNRWIIPLVAAVLLPAAAAAQNPAADTLRARMAALSARLDSLEAGRCPSPGPSPTAPRITGDPASDSLEVALHRLAARVARLEGAQCRPAAADSAADDLGALREAADAAAGAPDSAARDTAGAASGFVSRQRNLNALNPEISVTGDVRLVGREGVQRETAVDREFEFAFQSQLDPYSTAKVFIAFEDGEVAIEEGYVYWTGLPGRLRADLGRIRQPVGDLNRWHLHALPEGDYPLVYRRFLGEEGLAGVGLSLYGLLPVALAGGTHEVWLQGTIPESEPLVAGGDQPAWLARLQNFWQLSRSTYVQFGATAFGGRNRDSALTTFLGGADFRLTWRPPSEATRREVTLRAEGYRLKAEEAGLETTRFGAFAGLTARVDRRWVLGLRYDWVQSPRGPKADEWAVTPTLTWWQSEFVYLRLQGERHHLTDGSTDHRLTLQAVFAMGPHKHETY